MDISEQNWKVLPSLLPAGWQRAALESKPSTMPADHGFGSGHQGETFPCALTFWASSPGISWDREQLRQYQNRQMSGLPGLQLRPAMNFRAVTLGKKQ